MTGGEEAYVNMNDECIQDEEERYSKWKNAQMIGWIALRDGQIIREEKNGE